ncbi:MAG TPA: hypothetical protein VFM83_01760 [Gaiellaceae bacterium]|nr:hypothetical protein [Gaiellaceae bacterium]
MRRAVLAGLIAITCFAGTAKPARAADPCGLPTSGTAWIDFADGTVPFWYRFARPGVIAAASNFIFPPQLRAGGAKTIYFDLYLNGRVGTPDKPETEAKVKDWAQRIFYRAAASSGCSRPWMALNELFGAHTTTPWTPNNAAYRHNVITFVRALRELGARPMLLLSTRPYTQDEAGAWWREAAAYADLVQEVYFTGKLINRQGAVAGGRTVRARFREAVRTFTDIGIPADRVGIMLGFQASNRGSMAAIPWFNHVKLQALAIKQVARETGLGSVWSWGWQARNTAQADPDKEVGACIWLWTRDRRLCNGPELAGPDFDTSFTQQEIALPRGVRCSIGDRSITRAGLTQLTRVTGDPGVAFSAAYARAVLAGLVQVDQVDVLAAERAIIASHFRGSRAAYRRALARSRATEALAREVIADEVRQQRMGRRFRVGAPTAEEITSYYESLADTSARMIEIKPRAWWLGERREGLAIGSLAPPQVFGIPSGNKWIRIRTADGLFKVRSQDDAHPLGTYPLGLARPAVVAALKEIQRRQTFERWFGRPLKDGLDRLRCAGDELPAVSVVDLTTYMPYLALTA